MLDLGTPSLGYRIAEEIIKQKREAIGAKRNFTLGHAARIIDEMLAKHAPAKKPRATVPVAERANEIYAAYPRKVGPNDALRAITKALKEHSFDYLLAQTKTYAAAVAMWPANYRFKDDIDRCPHPATWFNAGRYADDPREWTRNGVVRRPTESNAVTEPAGWQDYVRANLADPSHADKDWHEHDQFTQRYISDRMKEVA